VALFAFTLLLAFVGHCAFGDGQKSKTRFLSAAAIILSWFCCHLLGLAEFAEDMDPKVHSHAGDASRPTQTTDE
jgi:hypothetical protein